MELGWQGTKFWARELKMAVWSGVWSGVWFIIVGSTNTWEDTKMSE